MQYFACLQFLEILALNKVFAVHTEIERPVRHFRCAHILIYADWWHISMEKRKHSVSRALKLNF